MLKSKNGSQIDVSDLHKDLIEILEKEKNEKIYKFISCNTCIWKL